MKEHEITEEQQKDLIFDIYSKWRDESSTDRFLIYYSQLCHQIYLWCKNYSFRKSDNKGNKIINYMGEEIAVVTKRIMENKAMPLDKNGYFYYLYTALNRGKENFYHEYNGEDYINIPKEKKRKLREVQGFIRMKESQLGRALTADERMQGVSKWFKSNEYVELLKMINIGSISYTSSDDNDEIDVLNYAETFSDNPLDEYIKKADIEAIREAVTSVLEKKQERSIDCYRALFTLYCINNNLRELYPILDQEIIDAFHKDGKTPNQYEIYQMYHPNVQKSSADAMASKNLREFLSNIETCLKEKKQ